MYFNGRVAVAQFWKSKAVKIIWTVCLALFAIVIAGMLSDAHVKQKVPVGPYGSSVFVELWSQGYVGLTGTWVIDNDKSAFPLQVSRIVCRLNDKSCTESRAEVSEDTLMVNQDSYEINRWDEHVLIYTGSAQCVDYVYTVNRDTKQVSGIRKSKVGKEKECPVHSKELLLRLADGSDVYWEMQRETRPVAALVAACIAIVLWAGFRIRRIINTKVPNL